MTEIKPQTGFQESFLSSEADIVIGGGAAGAGKTYALLLEALRHHLVEGFGAVFFRRTYPQIRNEGGLWDTASSVYPLLGAKPNESDSSFRFISGVRVKFSHMQYEKDVYDHQGAQYCLIGFDELTHFTKKQFFYLLSRNRSLCGVRPYVRATCNPDPESWVADVVAWWIDQETGFPIPERCGVLRYFIMDNNNMVWGDSPEEVIAKCPHIFNSPDLEGMAPEDLVKSLTFIPGLVYENTELLKADPSYLGNLLALDDAEKAQLLEGNWKIKTDGLALCDFMAVNDAFSNVLTPEGNKYITCDVARFGSDMAVIMVWHGWVCIETHIYTTSKTTTIVECIDQARGRHNVRASFVGIDQDGVGGGVVDQGGYVGFNSGGAVLPDPGTDAKENYKNLKTQVNYRLCQMRVNNGLVLINAEAIYVDGMQTDKVRRGKTEHKVVDLIKADLRSIKRKNADADGKKQMIPKEEQKNILNGRSPDFSDCMAIREWFDLQPPLKGAKFHFR